jgi:hypothetical protein
MKSLAIVFPPQFEPFEVYLSGPYLKALLAHYGVASSVFDANIDFFEWLVSRVNEDHPQIGPDRIGLQYLGRHLPDALRFLREDPSSLLEYRWAINVVDECLHVTSPKGVKIGLTYLKVGNRYSSFDLQTYLGRSDNMFAQYFEHAAEKILGPSDVSTYLLSLVVIDQLAAAVAFAQEIKLARPKARVIIGGPLVSRLHRQLVAVPWIAQTFDAIVPGEGYRVLASILGLTQGYAGHVTPDFSDIDLDRYWSCRRVLPYIVAHGCKWGKCTFCSHHLTYEGYRSSEMHDVVADLASLSAKHDAHYISFCDEYLTPSQLEELSDGLLRREVDVKWSTFARPEPQFRDRDFMHNLYAAGCRMLMFGLESGSQRMLQAMRKGTIVAHFRPILEACKEANIAIRCDFMIGFPGETEEDIRKTYDLIRENRDVIDTPFSSYSVAVFELRSGIPVLEQSERFQILPRNPLRGDLDDQYKIENQRGLSEQARIKWRERLIRFSKLELDAESICPQNKTHQLLLKDLYDRGILDLPVLGVSPDRFSSIAASLAPGVEVSRRDNNLRVLNHANGGELEVTLQLVGVFGCFKKGTSLDLAFRNQDLWTSGTFTRFISFLYRNDYISLKPIVYNRQSISSTNSFSEAAYARTTPCGHRASL